MRHLTRLLFITSCALGLSCGYDYSPLDSSTSADGGVTGGGWMGGGGSPSDAGDPVAGRPDAGPAFDGGIPKPGGGDGGTTTPSDGGCDCDDGNACTTDECDAGVCTHVPAGRIACTTPQGITGCCNGLFCCVGGLCC